MYATSSARPVLYFRVVDGEDIRAVTDRTVRWFARGDGEGDLEIDVSRIAGKAAAPTSYSVEVLVVDQTTGPLDGKDVTVFDVDLSASATTETPLGSGRTVGGRIRIEYVSVAEGVHKARPRLKVRAEEPGGGALVAEATICRAKPRERITLLARELPWGDPSHYARTLERVSAVLGPAALHDLSEAQIDVVACRAGLLRDEVHEIASAAEMNAAGPGVGTEAYYGMIRGGLPRTLADLALYRLPHIRRTLEESITRNDVSSTIEVSREIDELEDVLIAEQLAPRGDGVTAGVVAAQTVGTSTPEHEAFVRIVLNHEGDAGSFWEAVAADPVTGPFSAALRVTAEAAPLVASHPPMIAELSSRHDSGELENYRSLAKYTEAEWREMILPEPPATGVGTPPTTPGRDPAEQADNYAKSIASRVEARFRTRTIGWRIKQANPSDDMNKFFFTDAGLEKNPDFDFAGIRVDRYLNENGDALDDIPDDPPELRANVAARLKVMERLFNITDTHAQMQALSPGGSGVIKSASQIHELGLSKFTADYGSSVGGADVAADIFEKSCWTTAVAAARQAVNNPFFHGPTIKGLPNLVKVLGALPDAIADWTTLFGALDACACEHCQSVYGPAAYLVELLRFLSKQSLESPSTDSGEDKLFGLRPDIALIALDCANAETPLPYIDLVNEVLEVKTSNELPSPPGFPAGPISTTRDPDELLGAPETPYPQHFTRAYRYFAGEAVGAEPIIAYPPKSVFHLWDGESRALLEHLGVPRHELLRLLEKANDLPEAYADWIAAERLRLSTRAYRLIAGLDATAQQLWGTTSGSWVALHSQMPVFLRRARISFAEARELFATQLGFATIVPDDDDPCDTSKMAIDGLDAAKLGVISRLLRLRTALGWTIHEVDQVIVTAGGNALEAAFLRKLARLEDLRTRLRLAPLEAAPLFGDLSIHERFKETGDEERSFFSEIFLKKTVADPDTTVFMNVDNAAAVGTPKLNDHQPPILAGLSLTSADYRLLVASDGSPAVDDTHPLKIRWPVTTLDLTLASLSRLYRIATLTRSLGLALRSYLVLRAYTALGVLAGDEPGTSPDDAIAFLEIVDTLKTLRIDVAQLDFYLRDFATEPSGLRPTEDEVAFWEREIMDGVDQAMKAAEAVTDDDTGTLSKRLLLAFFTEGSTPYASIVSYVESGGEPGLIEELQPYVRDLPDAEEKLDAGGPLEAARDRYTYLARELSRYLDSLNFVVQSLSARFSIEPATIKHLVTVSLTRKNEHDHVQAAVRAFLPDLDPGAPPDPPPDPPIVVPGPFEGTSEERMGLLRRIQKAAGIVRQLGLSTREVLHLFPAQPGPLPFLVLDELPIEPPEVAIEHEAQPTPPAVTPSSARTRFAAWLRIARIVELRQSWKAGSESLFALFTAALTAPLDALQARIAEGTGWPLADVARLCDDDVFDLTAASFQDELALLRIQKAMLGVLRMGVSVDEAKRWTDLSLELPANPFDMSEVEDEDNPVFVARSIRRIARSRNGDDAWRDVIRPLRDGLREKQRDALVEHLLHRKNLKESRELFQDLLIDVEMSPCQLTSRIVHAAGSIQVFVMRSLLRYYDDFKIDENGANQWRWMRNYRVWEANRKIFLYPENWIEPDLRDDKTPLYQAFERQLRQGPTTLERAEAAYRAYLEGLEELSSLDVRAICVEEKPAPTPTLKTDKTSVYHVFARTRAPHRYYHRRHEDGAWTPWEKLDIDVEGDHLMPIFYEGSLYLFWPTFTEIGHPTKQLDSELPPWLNMQIGIRYAERRSGTWSAGQTLGPTIDLHAAPPIENISFQIFPHGPDRIAIEVMCHGKTHLAAIIAQADGTYLPGANPTASKLYHLGSFLWNPRRPAEAAGFSLYPLVDHRNHEAYGKTVPNRSVGRPTGLSLHDQRFLSNGDQSFTLKLYTRDSATVSTHKEVLATVPQSIQIVFPRSEEPTYEREIVFVQDRARSFVAKLVTFDATSSLVSLFDPQNVDSSLPVPSLARKYRFERFDHGHIYELRKALAARGLDGLLRRASQGTTKLQDLGGNADLGYGPNSSVVESFPKDKVDFDHGSPMGVYNWELFFHLPFAIATSLRREGRYEDALKWFHYILDPNDGSAVTGKANSFWKFKPFYENQDLEDIQDQLGTLSENTYVQQMEAWANADPLPISDTFYAQINIWRKNPFNPHAIARLRPIAYQKAVVIDYIDNLVEWADQLFTRDTMESVNEATQLYLMAWDILGPRPNVVPTQPPEAKTYGELKAIDPFGNAFIENAEAIEQAGGYFGLCHDTPPAPLIGTTYFCVPANDILLGKWDLIEDRLFKIRHCQNIEGITRQLPLFAPPIDPALLVQAAAFGVDFQTVLNDIAAGAPAYRFTVLQQKAVEFASFVSSLGAQLLSALEKKDAEHLSNLRADQEIEVHGAIRDTKKQQIAAAKQDLAAAKESKKLAETRRDFYANHRGLNEWESLSFTLSKVSQDVTDVASQVQLQASGLSGIPQFTIGISGTTGSPVETTSIGGQQAGAVASLEATSLSSTSAKLAWASAESAKLASYVRRDEEFELQEDLAKIEITQIEKQIAAAELRVAVAEHELALTDKQLTQARDVRRVMLEKFTKEDLYDWMQAEAAATYYQAYKLAYDLAKKAEKAFQIERGDTTQSYIRFNNWDSIRRGLLAGERLALDLRKLDAAYHEQNKRELELTKHVSLAKLDPLALLELRETGTTTFPITETDYDRDFQDHYFRRLKQVSVSVPCVAGPYDPVAGTLSLTAGQTRLTATAPAEAAGLTTLFFNAQSICTSTGRSDSGMFELNFRDERILPFEGAGAHYDDGKQWRFELSGGNEFNFDSIADLVLHINYTARQGRSGELLGPLGGHRKRLFHLNADFADAWTSYLEDTTDDIVMIWAASHFPFGKNESLGDIVSIDLYTRGATATQAKLDLLSGDAWTSPGTAWTAPSGPTTLTEWTAWDIDDEPPPEPPEPPEPLSPPTGSPLGTWRLSFTGAPLVKPTDAWIIVTYDTTSP